ncbi:hypothetical protein AB0E63_33040 [Kribbella sp. NPDC026596]|uniref:hypothetical protein n=1 Tax=Kribbella sp. NPDC026596 TaxID=3155122 RepID=UPI00340EC774
MGNSGGFVVNHAIDLQSADSGAVSERDLQEYRAYLQRAETRLSTLHRVAGAFISGAGLLTLLPLLLSGTFSGLLALILFYPSPGMPAPASIQRWLTLVPVLASITMPLAALYLLIRDLILFYFTARTFKREGKGLIYPRFVLSGIMVSESSLDGSLEMLRRARDDEYVQDLLVPSPAKLRRRMMKDAQSIGDLTSLTLNDNEAYVADSLQQYVLRQTASHIRTLPEEAAKMEASIARHLRFLRGLVLRYAKAFLLTIATTVVTIAASGVLTLLRPVDDVRLEAVNPQYVWLSTLIIYGGWGLVAVVIVRRPVFWLYADTSNTKTKRTPQSLLNFERATLAIGVISSLAIVIDAVMYVASSENISPVAAIMTLVLLAILIATIGYAVQAFATERTDGRRR